MSQTATTTEQATGTPARRDRIALPALISATAVSSLGNGLTALAIPWFVLITTGSAARMGLAAAASGVAMIVAGVLGGTAVDRLGFKRASIVSDIASCLTVAMIPTLYFLDLLSFWILLLLVFLGAVLDAPGASARRALIPQIVRRAGSTLERANSAMQFAQLTMGDLFAPLLAGVLIAAIGAASVLYINSATFVLSMLIVATLIPGAIRMANGSALPDKEPSTFATDLKQGFAYVASDPFLKRVIPISIAANFLFSAVFITLPVMGNEVFGSPRAFGIIAAGFGAGAAAGTIFYGVFGPRIRRFHVYWSAMLGATVGMALLALSTQLWAAVGSIVIVGLAIGPVNAAGMVIMQARVPEQMMGRVLGLLFAASGVAAPAGYVASGVGIEFLGLRAIIAIGAAGIGLLAMWIRFDRELKRLIDETEQSRPS